jgi:hypothetical protein
MNKMNKKKLLGLKPPSKYLIITNSDSQDKKETATYITSQKAKKLLKDENFCDYLFKVSNVRYFSILLKYPLSRFYSSNGINEVFDEVWSSLNVENLKNKEKDFTEYIELKSLFNDECKIYEIKIEYHKISIS